MKNYKLVIKSEKIIKIIFYDREIVKKFENEVKWMISGNWRKGVFDLPAVLIIPLRDSFERYDPLLASQVRFGKFIVLIHNNCENITPEPILATPIDDFGGKEIFRILKTILTEEDFTKVLLERELFGN